MVHGVRFELTVVAQGRAVLQTAAANRIRVPCTNGGE
jgi:hypothetical protein